MKTHGTSWFLTAAVLAGAVVFLVPSQVKADWSYEYQDDFSSDSAESESYFHSIFWPQGAYPPGQAYLYFRGTGSERELGFGDYHGQPAYLSYCLPVDGEKSLGAIEGTIHIDVRLPYGSNMTSSGYLGYSFSPDGIYWSSGQRLEPGNHDIEIESVRGSCYVIFFGTGILIDNLEVSLYSPTATIHVPEDFATIQEAIDSARPGEIVEVGPRTYSGDGNRNIDFRGKAITVRSSDGAGSTIIDCSGSASEGRRGFYFHGGEGPDSVLRGFTIRGAFVPGSDVPSDSGSWTSSPANPVGGGIYCEFSSPSIVDCIIENCTTELGGGIGVVSGSPTIIDCLIEDCRAGGTGQAESGGRGAGIGLIRGSDATILHTQINNNSGYYNSFGAGIYCWRSHAFFADCVISRNTAQGSVQGGGAFCGGPSARLELENCVISGNTAEVGGGLCAGSAGDSAVERVIITNCTIAHNSLSGDQTATTGGGIHSFSSNITIRNSIVWYNDGAAVMLVDPASSSPVLYSCIEGGYDGQGNIDSEPLFVSPGGGDYHLQSTLGSYRSWSGRWVEDSGYSPCIDAGDPQDPVGAEPLTNGKRINMGAYGGTAEASKGEEGLLLHVDKYIGNDNNSGLSRADAFVTIQAAVDASYNGDTIVVWPGVYREQVDLKNRAITLQSADDAAVVTTPTGFAFSFVTAEGSNCVLRNLVITGCSGPNGGAIRLEDARPVLCNLTITGNRTGINCWEGANPDIVNCILWNNTDSDLFRCRPPRYSCVQQEGAVIPGSGNISVDPLFANPGSGDYHLKSTYGRYSPANDEWLTDPVTSRCIDAGDREMDPGREKMPHGGRINMGAYGGTPFASLSGQPSWGEFGSVGQ
jgi:hypothetical protein